MIRQTVELDDDTHDRIEAEIERGLSLAAYRLALPLGPIEHWRGAKARVLAGRLAYHLGHARLGRAIHLVAAREHPDDPRVCCAHARALRETRGLLAMWHYVNEREAALPELLRENAEWHTVCGQLFEAVRDFAQAESRLERARELAPSDPWVRVERASLELARDRPEASLTATRELLADVPHYRPARQLEAAVLRRLGRAREAVEHLTEWSWKLESASLAAQLVDMLLDLEDCDAAERALARLDEVSVLAPPKMRAWSASVRCRIALLRGDRARAQAEAETAGGRYYAEIAKRLAAAAPDASRIRLPVEFVAQDFQTCGPATLTAIARFWSVPADHRELAAEICYEGTWDHVERSWAERNGFAVEEFQVTWGATRGLIDAGIPFALTSVHATSAHLQTVIGYDEAAGTILIQDPTVGPVEYLAETLLADQRPSGPRGMALVPGAMAESLRALELPASELYAGFYRLKRALAEHDREAAQREADALEARAPGNPLALRARLELASDDRDPAAALACLDALLGVFPNDPRLSLVKLDRLRTLGRREERLALIESFCARPRPDAVWWRSRADELRADARRWADAERSAARSLRLDGHSAWSWDTLASLRLAQGRYSEALAYARFASCLADTNEGLADQYRRVAVFAGRPEEGLAHLERRVAELGDRSGEPADTLNDALCALHRAHEGLAVLAAAVERRPDDGALALHHARALTRAGEHEAARRELERARPLTRPSHWQRVHAGVARAEGDGARELASLRGVAEAEPFEVGAHGELAWALNRFQGLPAALAYLREVAERMPRHLEIQKLYVGWLERDAFEEAERVLQRMVDIHPADAWCHRELAARRSNAGRVEDARSAALEAIRLEPASSYSHGVLGYVELAAGDRAAARSAYLRAIELDVDNAHAIHSAVSASSTDEERRDALAYVRRALEQQVVAGDGLAAFREAAKAALGADEVLAQLDDALRARPDLWQAHHEKIEHLREIGRPDDAERLARAALERFPHSAPLWIALARSLRLGGKPTEAADALARGVELHPDATSAVRELGFLLDELDRTDEALTLIGDAIARTPTASELRACRAWILRRSGDAPAAIDEVERLLRREPGSSWGWDRLDEWCRAADAPKRAVEFAKTLTAERPESADAWIALANRLGKGEPGERIAAAERAVALEPRSLMAIAALVSAHCDAGKLDAAREACNGASFGGRVPWLLRARAAWIDGEYGDLARGIAAMRGLLEEDPTQPWGWRRLYDWCWRAKDMPGAREAGEWLVRLAPDEAVSFGLLADAQLASNDKTGGRASLETALRLDADYEWAARTLFDLCLAERRFDDAERVLAAARARADGPYLRADAVRLAARARDKRATLAAFQQLLAAPIDHVEPVEAAFNEALRKVRAGALEPLLWKAAFAEPANEGAAMYAAKRVALHQGELFELRRLRRLFSHGDVGRSAAHSYIENVQGMKGRTFRPALVRRACGDRFRRDGSLWAEYGQLLMRFGAYRAARRWLADWKSRSDATAGLLVPVVAALRGGRRDRDAAQASRAAIALPRDHATDWHELWLALDDALEQRASAARARLAKVDVGQFGRTELLLSGLVEACLEVRSRDQEPGGEGYWRARARLRELRHEYTSEIAFREYRVAYRRAVRCVGRRRGGIAARAWALLAG